MILREPQYQKSEQRKACIDVVFPLNPLDLKINETGVYVSVAIADCPTIRQTSSLIQYVHQLNAYSEMFLWKLQSVLTGFSKNILRIWHSWIIHGAHELACRRCICKQQTDYNIHAETSCISACILNSAQVFQKVLQSEPNRFNLKSDETGPNPAIQSQNMRQTKTWQVKRFLLHVLIIAIRWSNDVLSAERSTDDSRQLIPTDASQQKTYVA